MKLNRFFDYRTHCPFCNKSLSALGEVGILTYSPETKEVDIVGGLLYNFNGIKFYKTNKFYNPEKIKTMDLLFESASQTFTIKNKLFPKLNKKAMNKAISPYVLDILDFKLVNICNFDEDHEYYYISESCYEDSTIKDLRISCEYVISRGIRIANYFENNKPIKTKISGKKLFPETIDYFKTVKIPYISPEKWDLSTEKSLKLQIDKYLLLL